MPRTPDGVRRVDATDVGRLAMDVPDDGLPVILLAELRHAGAAGREAALLAQRTGVPGVARRMLPHGPLALHHLAVAAPIGRPGPFRLTMLSGTWCCAILRDIERTTISARSAR